MRASCAARVCPSVGPQCSQVPVRQGTGSGPGGARRLFWECGACTLQAQAGPRVAIPRALCPHPRHLLPSPQTPLQASVPWAQPVAHRRGRGPHGNLVACGDSVRRAGPGTRPVFGSKVPGSRPLSFASCSTQSPLCKRSSRVGLPASLGPSPRATKGRGAAGQMPALCGGPCGTQDGVDCRGAGWGEPPGQGSWRASSGVVLG